MKIVLPVASHQRLNLHANKLCPNQPNFPFTQCCNEVFLTGLMSYNYLMVYRPTTTIREDFPPKKERKIKKDWWWVSCPINHFIFFTYLKRHIVLSRLCSMLFNMLLSNSSLPQIPAFRNTLNSGTQTKLVPTITQFSL